MENWMFICSSVYNCCDSPQPQTGREKSCSLHLPDLSLCSAINELGLAPGHLAPGTPGNLEQQVSLRNIF